MMKNLLCVFGLAILISNSLVMAQSWQDAYGKPPSAISCNNGKYELMLENTETLSGQLSKILSKSDLTVIDIQTGETIIQAVVRGIYYIENDLYRFGNEIKGRIELDITNVGKLGRRGKVTYYGRGGVGSVTFKNCRIFMKKP